MLHLKGLSYEIVEEPLREWTPWMKEWSFAHNERARVPVLRYVLDEGVEKVMPESNEMNLFLDLVDEQPKFTPVMGSVAYEDMQKWFEWCAKEFKPMIDLYKYGVNLTFDVEAHVFHTIELRKLVRKLEDTLKDEKYLIEDRLTLADIAIIPFVRQIMRTREGEFDFVPYPSVYAWTQSIIETNWFNDVVMQKQKTVH